MCIKSSSLEIAKNKETFLTAFVLLEYKTERVTSVCVYVEIFFNFFFSISEAILYRSSDKIFFNYYEHLVTFLHYQSNSYPNNTLNC